MASPDDIRQLRTEDDGFLLDPEIQCAYEFSLEERKKFYLSQLDLSDRTLNALERSNIMQIGDLHGHTAKGLLRLKDMGPNAIAELHSKLQIVGIRLDENGELIDLFHVEAIRRQTTQQVHDESMSPKNGEEGTNQI